MAYDAGYTASTGTDLAKAASGKYVMTAAKKDMIEDSVSSSAFSLAISKNIDIARYGGWNAYTDEERMALMEKWEKKVVDMTMAFADARAAAGLTMGDAEADEAVEEGEAEEAVEEGEGEEAAEGEDEEAAEGEEEDATIEE